MAKPNKKLGPATEEGRARALANLKPVKPGEVRNPKGRGTAGASVREWWNVLAAKRPTEDKLRAIAKNKRASWNKRTAALRMLRTLEAGDLADFEDLLKGRKTLGELREAGVNTEVVKRLKQKSRVVPIGEGDSEEVIEREPHVMRPDSMQSVSAMTDAEIRHQLKFTPPWFELGIVDDAWVALAIREYRDSDDQGDEHYRYGSFMTFFRRRKNALLAGECRALFELAAGDPAHVNDSGTLVRAGLSRRRVGRGR